MKFENIRIEYFPIESLKCCPANPKKHNIRSIQKSIEVFGFVSPLLLNERNQEIVAGHGRLRAIETMVSEGRIPQNVKFENGKYLIPVIRGYYFENNDEQLNYMVIDNKLTELGGWDKQLLEDLIKELSDHSASLLSDIASVSLDFRIPEMEDFDIENINQEDTRKETKSCPKCGFQWQE